MLMRNNPVLTDAPPSPIAVANPQTQPQPPETAEGGSAALAALKRAFLRQSAGIRAYRANRDQELAAAASD